MLISLTTVSSTNSFCSNLPPGNSHSFLLFLTNKYFPLIITIPFTEIGIKYSLLILLKFGFVNAQRILTGTVTDENGQKLSNVQVQDPQTKRWTQTNSDGFFTIELTNENTNLSFSQKGKETQEIVVDSSENNVSIVLYNQTLRLEQVDIFPKKRKNIPRLRLVKKQ